MNLILTILRPSRLFTMTSVVLILAVFTTSLWAFVTPANAATGINGQINFQGKLVDNNGLNVANSTYTVVFTLYDAASAGSNLWTETDSVTTTDGIFQVSLGAVNTALPSVNFNSDSIYLGIKVGADAEMTPRIRFTAVPYAFNAQKVNGLNVTNTSGNPFAGTTTLQIGDGKTVVINNGLTFSGTDSTTITFQGTDTYVGRGTTDILTSKTIGSTGLTFSGATADLLTGSNQNLTITANGSGDVILTSDADTGVSIGSASNTAAPLSISGGIGANAALIVNQLNSGDLFTASQAGSAKFSITNAGGIKLGTNEGVNGNCLLSGGAAAASTWGSCGSGGGVNYLRLAQGAFSLVNDTADFLFGDVGTASAKFKLSAKGTAPVASISASTSYAALVTDNTGLGDLFAASKSGATKFVIQNNGTLVAGPDAAAAISNNLVLPNTLAHFAGNTNSYAQVNVQNRSNGGSASSDFIATADNGNDTSNYIDFGINSSTYSDGAYTIGGANDGYLYNNGGNLAIGTQTAGKVLKFNTGGTLAANERMRIDANGNVSINNTSALATLDVRANTYTTPVASFSGQTGKATVMVDQSGGGDLFAASKSGATKFYINGNGIAFGSGLDGLVTGGTPGSPATITHVQSTGNFSGGTGPNITQAFGSNNTAGNFIVVAVTFDSSVASSVTCSDSQVNTYGTQVIQNDTTDNQELVICYAANIKAGANTVTATFNASSTARGIAIHEYSGVATSNPLDTSASQNAVATTSTDAVTSTASTTTNNGDLIFGAVFDNTSTTTIAAGTGFTQRTLISNALQTQDKAQVSAGSVASTHTFSATHRYNSIMAAFKPQINGASSGTSILSIGTANATTINMGANSGLVMDTVNNVLGIGTSSPLARLDVRGNSNSNIPTASFSANSTFAGMIVDNTGTGDLFSASKSGTMKFTVLNNGNLQAANYGGQNGVLYGTQNTGVFAQATTASSGQCLLSGASTPTWGSCAAGAAGPFNASNGVITQANTTNDFLLGGTSSSSAKFSVTGMNGNAGQLNSITTTTALPANRVGQSSVTANGYIYVLGGAADSNGNAPVQNVYYAKVNTDGTVGNWVGTTQLPAARLAGMATVVNGYIYYMGGGATGGTPGSQTWYAKLNSDGSVGAWATTTALPAINEAAGVASANGMIYIVGGFNQNSYAAAYSTSNVLRSVWSARVNADGSISNWNTASFNMPGYRANLGAAITNGYLYAIGGDSDTGSPQTTIFYSKIDPTTGAPDPMGTTSTALSATVDDVPSEIPVVNGYVYVYGYAPTTGNMMYFKPLENGNVTSVTAQNSAWTGQTAFGGSAVTVNGYLYYIGGMNSAQTVVYPTVQYMQTARVEIAGSLDLLSLNTANIASASGGGGSIYAGNIFSAGTLETTGGLLSWNGASIRGILAADQIFATGLNGTTPVASIAAKTSYAALVVTNTGTGDLMTASAGGTTRFSMANNGSVLFQGDTIASIGSGASGTGSNAVSNVMGDQGSLVPNAGFESNLLGGVVADGWVTASGSALLSRDTATPAKGSVSLKATLGASSVTAVYSACLPLALNASTLGSYNLNFYAKPSVAARVVVRGYLDGYPSKANCQSDNATGRVISAPQGGSLATANTWATTGSGATGISNLGASITWARVHILIACPASCGAGTTVGIDGVRLIENANSSGLDYAENYPADPNNIPEAGDVVTLQAAGDSSQVYPAHTYMDQSVIGVVSTNPGQVLDDATIPEPKVAIALAGRIPTKVSTKNGAIHVGDYLTSSDTPGVAVKAITAGPVIGQAMEEYNQSDATQIGKVVMFVKNTYYNGIPLTLNSGLTQDHAQGDLEFLGTLVEAAQKTASSSSALTKVSADHLVAGLDVIAPKVTTDTLQVNTIKSAGASDISVRLSDAGEFVIRNASGEAKVAFDGAGNAYFAGTITADKIKANQIEGLDVYTSSTNSLESRVSALESLLASSSAIQLPTASPTASPIEDQVFLASLESVQDATVSGSLRVQGNGLIEGVLHVVDTVTAGNLIVNQVADFFSNVVFHGDVLFAGHPTFNADTAGYVTIPKGSDNTTVTFKEEYKSQPVINASIVTQQVTDDFYKKLQSDGVCTSEESKADCEDTYTKSILSEGAQFVIAKRSTKGFIIVLSNKTTQDMTFSWSAFSVGTQTSMKGSDTQ